MNDLFEKNDPMTEMIRSWGWIETVPPTFPAWACVRQSADGNEWKFEYEGSINSQFGLPLLFRDESGALRAVLYFYKLYQSLNKVPSEKWKALLIIDENEFETLRIHPNKLDQAKEG